MHLTQPMLAAGLLFSLTTLNAEAALTPYTSAGENLVYSSVSDITWTADGNLLGTMISNQGYNTVVNAIIAASPVILDTPNYYDGSYGDYDGDNSRPNSGQYSLSASDFSSSYLGLTTWFGAKGFVNYLNSIDYAGTNQWALPSAGVNPQFGLNQTGSQFGQMYYSELNKQAYPGTNGSNYGILGDGSVRTSGSVGPFSNAQAFVYWLNTEDETDPDVAWLFGTFVGMQDSFDKDSYHYAWAVSPGQLSSVPVPSAVWLFGTGLLGLVRLKRRGYAG